MPLTLRRVDTSSSAAAQLLKDLRAQLSPDGEIVSERGRALTTAVFGEPLAPSRAVERICGDVRRDGFPAAQRYSRHFDQFALTLENLRVRESTLGEAHAAADPRLLDAVRGIRKNLLTYQSGILHRDATLSTGIGHELRLRYRPIRRVGILVPGGAAAYPSSLLMTAIPAQAAGVPELAVVAPPTANGSNNPVIQALCHELGIKELYRLGGAQAVAALAYGLDGLPPVDMIVGPGNLFVTLAKRFVYGAAGIDMLAGPSEVIVIADETANPEYVAADLIAQAEHAPGSSLLLSWSDALIDAVTAALERQLAGLSRGELARESLERYGALIRVQSIDEAVRLANEFAPEHLHVQTRHAEAVAERIPYAGCVFVGDLAPVAMGDYAAGPSHVLPTGGTARFSSGLSSNDFLKRSCVVKYNSAAFAHQAPAVRYLAEIEGLPGHAASVALRQAGTAST